jgi:hypothetical protein
LCDEGIALASQVFASASLELVDVDLDLVLLRKYGDRVPVIQDPNGTIIDEGIIDKNVLQDYARSR